MRPSRSSARKASRSARNPSAGVRRRVSAVHEHVQEQPFHPRAPRQPDEGMDVFDGRVHAPVGEEPHEMHRRTLAGRGRHGRSQHRVVEEGAIDDGAIDAREILIQDASGTQGEVAHLGVAHDARRQTHRLAAGLEQHPGMLGQQRVPGRRRARLIALPGPGGAYPQPSSTISATGRGTAARRRCGPSVGHRENSTMAANESTSRLAPPTRAPSMSGRAIRSPMLSGFTLPPYRIRTD